MTDETFHFKDGNGSKHLRPSPEIEAEIHRLTGALLDGNLTDEQRRRLEEIVISDPAATEVYLEFMYEWGSLPNHIVPSSIDLRMPDEPAQPAPVKELNETMILPALHLEDLPAEEDVSLVPPPPPVVMPVTGSSHRWIGVAAAIAFVAITGFLFFRSMHHATPGAPVAPPQIVRAPAEIKPSATITAIATFKGIRPGAVSVGASLIAGQQLVVEDGAMEVTFVRGAVVVVQAPARFHILDDNSIALDDGKLAAHVPPAATGFCVISPGLMTVDRGTDFGVRSVPGNAASEVHIFGGVVDVAGTDAKGTLNTQAVRAVTGNAFRHDVTETTAPAPVAFSPQNFTRDISAIRRQIPLHNTGDGLVGGQPDPNWQIESAPAEMNWKPQPAIVVSDPIYTKVPNTPTGKWISVDGSDSLMPSGIFIFKTTVDLKGFDPATAKIKAILTGDDCVLDIRVNGISTGLSTKPSEQAWDYVETALDIPCNALHGDVNQIEIVINNQNATDGTRTPTGLKAVWEATACAPVQR